MPDSLPGFPGNNTYSPSIAGGGRMPFGISAALLPFFGNKVWPILNPTTPQSQFDAVWQRQHDMQMMQMARNTVSSWYPFQNMGGMNQNSLATQIVSSMLSQPDGITANIMSPILGGNPIQAQMSSYANLQGMAASGLGGLSGTSIGQLSRAREMFEAQFYNSGVKPINKDLGNKYRTSITSGLQSASILGLSQQDISGLFNSNNEINAGSTAFTKISKASQAIEDLQTKLNNGNFSDVNSLLSGLDQAGLGDMTAKFKSGVSGIFDETSAERNKIFRDSLSGSSGELKGLADKLIEAQAGGKGKEELIKMIGNSGLKLDDTAKDKMTKAVEEGFNRGGGKLADRLGEVLNKKDITSASRDISMVGNLMLGQKLTRGVNYENTMGFNYEDLISARNEMIKSRLVSGNLNGLSTLFGGGGGGYVTSALDAARGLFGNNLSGKELAQQIDQFVGYSNIDLANPADAKKLEDTIRNLKATARVSNLDPAMLLGLVNQGQAFAGQNAGTARLGGIELAGLVTAQANNVAALSSGLDPQSVRWQGGTSNMLKNRIQGSIESASDPIAQQLAALHTYFSHNKDIQSRIVNFAQSGQATAIGYRGFLESLPGNANELLNYARNNKTATQIGFSNASSLLSAGGNSKVDSEFQRLYYQYGGSAGMGDQVVKRAQKLLAAGNINAFLTDSQINVGEFAEHWSDLASKGYLDKWMINSNPTMRKNHQLNQDAINTSAKLEKEIAKKMGKMNAPTLQRLVQAITSGQIGKDGLSALLEPLGISGDSDNYGGITSAADIVGKIEGSKNIGDLGLNVGLSSEDSASLTNFSELAAKYGVSSKDIDAIIKGGDISSLVTNKGAFAKDGPGAAAALIAAATKVKGIGKLSGYGGDFSLSSLQGFFKSGQINGMIDQFTGQQQVDSQFNSLLNNDLNSFAKSGDAGLKKLAQGLLSLGGSDQVFDLMDKLKTETAYTTNEVGGDTTYKLGDAHAKLAKALGWSDETMSSSNEELMQQRVAALDKISESSPAVNQLVKARADFKSGVEKTKEEANQAASMAASMTKILDKLGELPKLTEALSNIADTLAGKAHQ